MSLIGDLDDLEKKRIPDDFIPVAFCSEGNLKLSIFDGLRQLSQVRCIAFFLQYAHYVVLGEHVGENFTVYIKVGDTTFWFNTKTETDQFQGIRRFEKHLPNCRTFNYTGDDRYYERFRIDEVIVFYINDFYEKIDYRFSGKNIDPAYLDFVENLDIYIERLPLLWTPARGVRIGTSEDKSSKKAVDEPTVNDIDDWLNEPKESEDLFPKKVVDEPTVDDIDDWLNEPKKITKEPKEVTKKPKEVTKKPKEVTEEPTVDDIDDWLNEPKEVTKEPEESKEEPTNKSKDEEEAQLCVIGFKLNCIFFLFNISLMSLMVGRSTLNLWRY
jgi:hypothetical protein